MSAGQLRLLKGRIRSVENTKKITRAMEMVSAAKLRRFQDMMSKAQPYTQGLEEMIGRLVSDQKKDAKEKASAGYTHPFFEEREEKKAAVVFITSDTGLCGSYNSDLIELARQFFAGETEVSSPSIAAGATPLLIGLGKTGVTAYQKEGYDFQKTFVEIRQSEVEPTIKQLTELLESSYLNQDVDAVYVIYSHFVSASAYRGTIEKILPFKQVEAKEDAGEDLSSRYIYEPSPELIFERLIPEFFEAKVRMLFLESYVSEHMARMNAMHQATKNAKEMIDSLVLVRNKVRQAIITKEIIEIISGSQALKK